MKKLLSFLLVLCCLMTAAVPALADTQQLSGGEALAMMFINEFFANDPQNGIAYDVKLDGKHFIITAMNPLLESVWGVDQEKYVEYSDKIFGLFDSVDSLMRTSTGDDEYYMTLTFYLAESGFEHPYGAYCAFSSLGGTPHKVNDQFVTTSEMTYYVANEGISPETIQYVQDYFTSRKAVLHYMGFLDPDGDGKGILSISVSGEYCDGFAAGYKGKAKDWVDAPERYGFNAKEMCAFDCIYSCSISFMDDDGNTFGSIQYNGGVAHARYFDKQD